MGRMGLSQLKTWRVNERTYQDAGHWPDPTVGLSTQHSALGGTDGREDSVVSRLWSLGPRQSSVVCVVSGQKRGGGSIGARGNQWRPSFCPFFFLVAIGLASRNKERAGGDRRGEADECCDGMRECFLWRRGTCRSWASMACRLPPSRSRASSEASVLLFFLVEGGPWCGNVCGFRRDSACHLAPASVSCRADSRRRVALHEWDRRHNLGRGATPTRTHIRPRPPARDNNPSRKLIEDDGRAVRGPTSLLLARGRPTKSTDRTKEQRRKKAAHFAFFSLQHAADDGRRTTDDTQQHPESHVLSSVPPAAHCN